MEQFQTKLDFSGMNNIKNVNPLNVTRKSIRPLGRDLLNFNAISRSIDALSNFVSPGLVQPFNPHSTELCTSRKRHNVRHRPKGKTQAVKSELPTRSLLRRISHLFYSL